jgi:hypothetical protein
MAERNSLQWLSAKIRTAWWYDSGDPAEPDAALENGAVGATTNPVLCAQGHGLTQRTLSQFIESGWKLLEQFTP